MSRRWSAGALCIALMALTGLAAPAAEARLARSATRPCASYVEAGLYTAAGVENQRIAVSKRQLRCGAAITIVREFRSALAKRHHGPSGSGWWTLPSAPGWRCRKRAQAGGCTRAGQRADFEVTMIPAPAHCRDSVPLGAGGVALLSWRGVACGLRKRIARQLGGPGPWRNHGFLCHRLALRAGGGGALCRRGARFLEIGYE